MLSLVNIGLKPNTALHELKIANKKLKAVTYRLIYSNGTYTGDERLFEWISLFS
jgi:hypothetical protein